MTVISYEEFIVSRDSHSASYSYSIQKSSDDFSSLPNSVVVSSIYSSLNYKDILSCTGHPGVTRRYPHRPGTDLVGTVLESTSELYSPGDLVYTCAYPLGTSMHGTFSTVVSSPANYFQLIPKLLSPRFLMLLGTAGFTAGNVALKCRTVQATGEPLYLVSGATSSTGQFIVLLLNKLGIAPSILIRADSLHLFPKHLRIDSVFNVEDIMAGQTFGLGKSRFSIIIDLLGGPLVRPLLSMLYNSGHLFSIGNILGSKFECSLLPFFQRGVTIHGINSESCTSDYRSYVWSYLRQAVEDYEIEMLNRSVDFTSLPLLLSSITSDARADSRHVLIGF